MGINHVLRLGVILLSACLLGATSSPNERKPKRLEVEGAAGRQGTSSPTEGEGTPGLLRGVPPHISAAAAAHVPRPPAQHGRFAPSSHQEPWDGHPLEKQTSAPSGLVSAGPNAYVPAMFEKAHSTGGTPRVPWQLPLKDMKVALREAAKALDVKVDRFLNVPARPAEFKWEADELGKAPKVEFNWDWKIILPGIRLRDYVPHAGSEAEHSRYLNEEVAAVMQRLGYDLSHYIVERLNSGRLPPENFLSWVMTVPRVDPARASQVDASLQFAVTEALERVGKVRRTYPTPLHEVEMTPELRDLKIREIEATDQLKRVQEISDQRARDEIKFEGTFRAGLMKTEEFNKEKFKGLRERLRKAETDAEKSQLALELDTLQRGLDQRVFETMEKRRLDQVAIVEKEQADIERLSGELVEVRAAFAQKAEAHYRSVPTAESRGFPFGFGTKQQFELFSRDYLSMVQRVLKKLVPPGTPLPAHLDGYMEGSSARGLSYEVKEGRDLRRVVGLHSDLDIAVEVPKEVFELIMSRAQGVTTQFGARDSGVRAPAISIDKPHSPFAKVARELGFEEELKELMNKYPARDELGNPVHRNISIMFYRGEGSFNASRQDAPALPLPKSPI